MKFKREYVFLSLIIIVSFIPYSNIFENEFVWDDLDFILGEPHGNILSDYFIFPSMHGLYRPVRGMAFDFMKDSFGEGLFFYHLLSIILHIICSVLAYLISKKLLSRDLSALLSSLIFAVHPIHTARVTNMTASFDLIGIALILASFYVYIANPCLKRLKFSLPFFLLALFSSEEALILPFLIFAYLLIFGFDKKNMLIYFYFFRFHLYFLF